MKKWGMTQRAWALGVGMALSAGMAAAAPDQSTFTPLMQANGCASCHSVNEKIVGPAFQTVAAKYAGDKDAAASLMQSIQNGSRGKWGRIPMPAHPSLSQAELKELATWVLAQKP
ncbi:c-type cytochrome [Malikia sp.]|uniref:c-type cytochrome n=1 Tax=Malikia sp. TaxID=2070706 RepID=UPI00260CBBA1|nr:c-type cytochrome [Malikia sp.]MDD2728042.1 c-type cytochrome [Malikia sp.]